MVFTSYTHDSQEHEDRVLALVDRLMAEGIDCEIDQFVMSPPEKWASWMVNQIESADFVLVVVTETYAKRFRGKDAKGKGKGAKWEGAVITQELYDAEGANEKFIPIVLSPQDTVHIPSILRGVTYYDLSVPHNYESLYRRLTNQPEVVKRSVGKIGVMPVRQRVTDFIAPSEPKPPTKQNEGIYSDDDRRHDTELLRFYSQALDRPAFQDSFRQEGSWHAFDKAIEDTITAINTGMLCSRDGTPLASGKGKSFLRHQGWRTRMDGIVDMLRALRSRFREALTDGRLTTNGGKGYYHLTDYDLARWIDETNYQCQAREREQSEDDRRQPDGEDDHAQDAVDPWAAAVRDLYAVTALRVFVEDVSGLKGEWIGFFMHAKWTGDPDGFCKLWVKAGHGKYAASPWC